MVEVYFEKEDYADYTDPENWDIISDNVALTRVFECSWVV